MTDDITTLLERNGIRPTPNRLLTLRALLDADRPMSLSELEQRLDTVDKSSIFRVVNLLVANHIVHTVEDGEGTVKYEACADGDHHHEQMHAHFYCRSCHRTFCLPDETVPPIAIPEGFKADSVNYMAKGLCPDCTAKQK